MSEATLIAVTAMAIAGIAVAARLLRESGEVAVVGLTFPRTVSADQATAAARSLAGLLPPWWRRFFGTLRHARSPCHGRRSQPRPDDARQSGRIREWRPSRRHPRAADGDEPESRPARLDLARELHVSGPTSFAPTPSTAATRAFSPACNPWKAASGQSSSTHHAPPTAPGWPATRVCSKTTRTGPVEPQFAVAIRAAVTAPSSPRSRSTHRPPAWLLPRHGWSRSSPSAATAAAESNRRPSDRAQAAPGGSIIGADELAAVWALPLDAPELPGLTLANSRELPPAASVPRRGLILGDSTVAGVHAPRRGHRGRGAARPARLRPDRRGQVHDPDRPRGAADGRRRPALA